MSAMAPCAGRLHEAGDIRFFARLAGDRRMRAVVIRAAVALALAALGALLAAGGAA